ncbi:MAG: CsiV family protein [Gammaproteobacteria bacterium]|nr:CsiV family protein [Gammaproteobacteria bacterium]
MIRLSISLGLLLCASLLQAADDPAPEELKYYDVEIIVFKNNLVPKGKEINLPTPSATPTDNTIDLADVDSVGQAETSGFTPLPLAELRLSDTVNRIIRSSRYELLVHTGWRQPGLDADNSIPVWIIGGRVFGREYSSIDQANLMPSLLPASQSGAMTDPDNAPDQTRVTRLPDVLYELEGMVTISLSRYLHTRAELVLRKPAQTEDLMQQALINTDSMTADEPAEISEGRLLLNYELNEQRRMRSRKLHYLDHPEFGLLVLITPAELSEAEEPAADAELTGAESPTPVAE